MFERYVYTDGLTSLKKSNDCFWISVKGEVKDVNFNDVLKEKDFGGFDVVKVVSWDGYRLYRVIDLIVIHFKDLYIPEERYSDVLGFPLDGNKNNVHAQNVGYRFKQKIEVKGYPGFYHVPGFTKYALNKNGQLYNVLNKTLITWYITPPKKQKNIKGGYRVYGYSSKAVRGNFSRHRGMLLTFSDYPDNCYELIVNHINGIPGDDRLENLEWMTRGENNIHAYVNDLKNQHDRVLCRDVITGNVVEYYSISECARQLGYPTSETIRRRLVDSPFCKVFGDGKQFKYKDEVRDWVIPDDPLKAVQEAKECVEVIGRNCATLKECVFGSMIDAFRKIGVNDATIALRLSVDDMSPLMGWQFKKLGDPRPFPSFTEEEYTRSLIPNSFKVNCRNLLTKEERTFNSINIASKSLGNTSLSVILRRGDQPLLPDGWQVKFENQEWEEITDFEEELYKRTKNIMAKCEKTGKVIIAESARQMAKVLSKDPKAIRRAAHTRGNQVYHGYRFRLGLSKDPWPTALMELVTPSV